MVQTQRRRSPTWVSGLGHENVGEMRRVWQTGEAGERGEPGREVWAYVEGKIQAAGFVHESHPAHTSHKHRATYTMGLDIGAQVISARVGGVPGRVAGQQTEKAGQVAVPEPGTSFPDRWF